MSQSAASATQKINSSKSLRQTEEYVRANPTKSIAYAVLAGFILDRLPIGRIFGGLLRVFMIALNRRFWHTARRRFIRRRKRTKAKRCASLFVEGKADVERYLPVINFAVFDVPAGLGHSQTTACCERFLCARANALLDRFFNSSLVTTQPIGSSCKRGSHTDSFFCHRHAKTNEINANNRRPGEMVR
jgi:hypothetical protein